MTWTEVIITVDAADVDRAGDIAHMAVPYGIYIEDYSHLEEEALEIAHIGLIDEALLQKDRAKALIHIYISPEESPAEAIAFLTERYGAAGLRHTIATAPCVSEDWMNNWKKYYKPVPVGERLLIRPVWEEDCGAGGRTVINLEPGLAFGTGTHETTRLCLALLERYVRPGCAMLDVGSGSGILSVAALLLGAGSAVGVDIDPLAVKTAAQNAALNGVEDRFTAVEGDLIGRVTGTFDIVAANIVADVIIGLTKDIGPFLKPDSVYVMSGIIDEREEEVLRALRGRFTLLDRREERGWVALAARPAVAP